MSGKGSGVEMGTRDLATLSSMTDESCLRSEDGDDERLLPGLPNEIILHHIVPKLQWKTFHILSSVSCRWREEIQSRHVYDARVRSHSTEKLFAVLHHASCDNHQPQTISLYSVTDNSWHRLPKFPSSWESWQGQHRRGIPRECQCVSLDGKIYVLGGVYWRPRKKTKGPWISIVNDDIELVCSEVYVLDLAGQREWKRCADMPQPRYAFGCGVVDGKIHVLGGVTCRRKFVRESLVYDPKANVWSSIQPMKYERYRPQVVAVGEELFVHGGRSRSTAEVYHAGKDQWRFLELFDPCEAAASVTAQGKVYMTSPLAIYGLDNDSDGNYSWTRLHSISFKEEQFLMDLEVIAIQAINDELIVLLWGCNVRIREGQLALCRSIGFGSKNEEIVWDKIDRLPGVYHLMVPIQL